MIRPHPFPSPALPALILGLLALAGPLVRAEGTAPATQAAPALRLTLAEALRRALDQNPRVHQALLAIAERAEDRRSAAAALMPKVGAEVLGQRNKYNLEAQMGMTVPTFPREVGPYNWNRTGVGAEVTLFDLGLWKKWRAAQHGERAAEAQGRAVQEEVAAIVVGQYLRALRAAASVQAGTSRVALAEALAGLAEHQQKVGVGTRLDTLRAQVQLQAERQRLIQAQTQEATALAGLGRVLDLTPGTRLELTDTLAAPALPLAGLPEAVQEGLARRPELAALDAQDRAAQQLKEAAWSLHLPTLTASGFYGQTALESRPSATTHQVSVGVRVPLFTGGLVSAQVARATAEQLRVQEARREVRAQVGYEVQVARAELEAAAHEVEVATLAVTLSTEALTQAQHRFEAGVSSNIEVISAQDELAKANDGQISALYRLNQARADLAHATGQLASAYAPTPAAR